jgi:hypothetical protein
MIHTIYLDLDDVLNTLTPFLLRYVGAPVAVDDYSSYPGKLDIVPAVNWMLGRQYTQETFWQSIPRRIWVEAPRSAEFHWLLRACKRAVASEVYIATSPTKDPECLAGKLEWMHAHLPKWMHRQFFVTPRKWKLAQPGTLLVDDNEANCRKFEAAGGVALRFPRPWNDAWGEEPRPYLEAGLLRAGLKIS